MVVSQFQIGSSVCFLMPCRTLAILSGMCFECDILVTFVGLASIAYIFLNIVKG